MIDTPAVGFIFEGVNSVTAARTHTESARRFANAAYGPGSLSAHYVREMRVRQTWSEREKFDRWIRP